MIRDERAEEYSRRAEGWFAAKIREAYRAGWNDAEQNFMDRVEAMQKALKEVQDESEAGNL